MNDHTQRRMKTLSLAGLVALVCAVSGASSPAAHATCSTSSNRVDNPKTKKTNENTDDIFVLRHGIITALGSDIVYGGGDGNHSYLGYMRNEGHIEISGGDGRGGIHGATSDDTSSASVSLDDAGPHLCVNDTKVP